MVSFLHELTLYLTHAFVKYKISLRKDFYTKLQDEPWKRSKGRNHVNQTFDTSWSQLCG